MTCDDCVALPRVAIGLSAVCDCGISRSYSLTIINVIANLFIMGSYLIINYAENYLSQQSLLSTDIRHVFVVNLHIIFPSTSGFPPT